MACTALIEYEVPARELDMKPNSRTRRREEARRAGIMGCGGDWEDIFVSSLLVRK